MSSTLQPSFTGGELAPALHGRVDLARYLTSVKACPNFIVQQSGGLKNRAGTRFIGEAHNSATVHRLIPFEFSTTQTYVLEFGNLTMRVIKDGGLVESSPGVPLVVATPYATADLPGLNWTQSADVLTVVHPSHAPRQISRTSHTAWTVTPFATVNGPFQDINVDDTMVVTASAATGAGVTLTASATLFAAYHVGQLMYFEDGHAEDVKPWVAGQIGVAVGAYRRSDGKVYKCTTIPTVLGAKGYRTGGVRPSHEEGRAWDGDTSKESTDNYAEGVEWEYQHSGFGIAQITGVTSGTVATATIISRLPTSVVSLGSYKHAFGAWGGDQGYPSAVTYFQNRQVFGGTTAQPQTTWMSRIGNYRDFGTSQPIIADDAITFPIPGRQVNAVRHFVEIDKLAILTSGSEWVVSGGQEDVITPETVAVKPQGRRGSAAVPPLIVGNTVLYIQDKGKTIRELAFDFASDTYTGQDLTQLAGHLFANHRLVEWCYQQVPFQVVWCVRDDGALLGMTYLKEQQVVGWHPHHTDGAFESVACISEAGEDVLYCIVRRSINGATRRYIERLNTRTFATPADWFFVDSGLTYDGRNTGSTTMTLATTTDWTYQQGVFTVSASAATFAAGDIGAEVHFPVGDQVIRMAIIGFTSSTAVSARANRDIPAALQGLATTEWSLARRAFAGMDHLEGKTCNVLADGNVHPQSTVVSGSLALQYAAAVVHAGLPITADIETLSITMSTPETILDKKKLITALRMVVEETRGLRVGPDVDHLVEIKQRNAENYDAPTAAATGILEERIPAAWSKDGRVFVRQSDPLPATVLAIIPDVAVGGS